MEKPKNKAKTQKKPLKKFLLRMPEDVAEGVEGRAVTESRSTNSQIVHELRQNNGK